MATPSDNRAKSDGVEVMGSGERGQLDYATSGVCSDPRSEGDIKLLLIHGGDHGLARLAEACSETSVLGSPRIVGGDKAERKLGSAGAGKGLNRGGNSKLEAAVTRARLCIHAASNRFGWTGARRQF